MDNTYDVAIIGGGVVGTALSYTLAEYTDLDNIALFEKESGIAPLNSDSTQNSQTLHFGDIETNYDLEKALEAKEAASMVRNYAQAQPNREHLMYDMPKMVLGVGNNEITRLEERFEVFQEDYPGLEKWGAEDIRRREPAVVKDREEDVIALGTDEGYAVDYGKLAESFVWNGILADDTSLDVALDTPVHAISDHEQGYRITADDRIIHADAVVVAAGAHSLLHAQNMGYGEDLGVLPVAGSFYFAVDETRERLLNGKVYTVQDPKLPFAAMHGDPDVNDETVTRFGPTAEPLPFLERRNYDTFPDFLRSGGVAPGVLKAVGKRLRDKDTRRFMAKNMLYKIPVLGKRLVAAAAQKIVPSLDADDLTYTDGVGGIRPQIVDLEEAEMVMGESKLVEDDGGLIFNMTPSPGATTCLKNAEEDAKTVAEYLDAEFDKKRHETDLKLVDEVLEA